MKRIHAVLTVLVLAVVAGVAWGEADVSPFVSNYQKFRHKVQQRFDVEVQASFIDAGTVTASTLTATSFTSTGGTGKFDTVDAGATNVVGILGVNRPTRCGGASACGTCNLASASPSTCTATVESGSLCVCWPIGTTAAIAAGGCAANVSSTTATFTGPNTVTTTIRYMCFL